jgi:hypothetical protein
MKRIIFFMRLNKKQQITGRLKKLVTVKTTTYARAARL